jgi:proteic killer suppression protein
VIRSFRHRGIEAFFLTGSKAGIQASHAKRLRLQLTRLNGATGPGDMNSPGWRLHPLKGDLGGH